MLTDPDQNSIIFINGKSFWPRLGHLQVFNIVVIEVESALQGAIGDPLLTLKQLDDLGDKLIKSMAGAPLRWLPLFCIPKMTHFRLKGRVGCAETVSRNEGRDGRRGVSIRQ